MTQSQHFCLIHLSPVQGSKVCVGPCLCVAERQQCSDHWWPECLLFTELDAVCTASAPQSPHVCGGRWLVVLAQISPLCSSLVSVVVELLYCIM